MEQTRDILKTYFETGDYPTEAQFAELIDSYTHLDEFNFGLSVKPTARTLQKFYHFYVANNVRDSGAGHKIVEAASGSTPEIIGGYTHVLSRQVLYKNLEVTLIGDIDIVKHQPKVIIERYKQRKKLNSGHKKPAGFYKELPSDAALWNRKSEHEIAAQKVTLDVAPINYFKPHNSYGEFSPSGSFYRPGSFKYSRHAKPFVPIQLRLQIMIGNKPYLSQPVGLKIMLGISDEFDAINYVFS